jgi:hypothetical protein
MENLIRLSRRLISACASAALAALVLGFESGCAANHGEQQSASTAGGGQDSFSLADADHDGKLSRGEAGDYLVDVVFVARDKNRDGRLTQEVWTHGDATQIAAFKLRDANEEGAVTLEDATVYGRRGGAGVALIKRADRTRDGKLNRAELEAYSASLEGSAR